MTSKPFTTFLWFDTQSEEAARYYVSIFKNSRLGGQEVACGWVTDKYGLSWQVVPTVFFEMINDPDEGKAARVTAAMLAMTKFDVSALERAYAGTA
jgi:predicted 3-demethylubiquinone-9 3-methyltransferase (glyoxalase superfamily)